MPENAFSIPALGLLRRHLLSTGWRLEPIENKVLDVFVLSSQEKGDEDVEIVLNKTTDGPDSDKRVLQALRTLGDLRRVPVEEVAATIRSLDFDIIRARLPDVAVIRDSIQFRSAERFLANIRRLLSSAAAAQSTGKKVVDEAVTAGVEFVNACRLGHTFRGSFGFTVEAPVGPHDETLAADLTSPPPFERRVVERIAKGLRAVESTAALGDPQPLFESLDYGFNVNMLEELITLVERTSGGKVTFDISFSNAWRSSLDRVSDVAVSADSISLLQDVISHSRESLPKKNEKIIGTVFRLETRENPADLLHAVSAREIAIEVKGGDMEGRTVRVRLAPENYLQAVEAHRQGQLVLVEGRVDRNSRGHLLAEPHSFTVLS